jgi:hypothetical protein
MLPFLTGSPFSAQKQPLPDDDGVNPLAGILKKKAGITAPPAPVGINPAAPPLRDPSVGGSKAFLPALPDASGIGAVRPQPSSFPDPSGIELNAPTNAPVRPSTIPAVAGRTGDMANTPVNKAYFDWSRQKEKRDAAGNPTGEYGRSWKDVAVNALLGFTQGAARDPRNPLAAGLGGAATAGTLSAISPKIGKDLGFEMMVRPQVEAEQARQLEAEKAAYDARRREIDLAMGEGGLEDARNRRAIEGDRAVFDRRKREVDLRGEEARTGLIQAQTQAAKEAVEREKQYKESLTKLNAAKEESIRKGKPILQKLVLEDGKVHSIQVFPDGTQMDWGVDVTEKQIQSRQQIAGQQEAGRNARAGQAEAGRNSRASAKGGGAGGAPTVPGLIKFFKEKYKKNISEAEAQRMLQSKGIK